MRKLAFIATAVALSTLTFQTQAAEPTFREDARAAIEACKNLSKAEKGSCIQAAKSTRKNARVDFITTRSIQKSEAKTARQAGVQAAITDCKAGDNSKACKKSVRTSTKAKRTAKKAEQFSVRSERKSERLLNKAKRAQRKADKHAL